MATKITDLYVDKVSFVRRAANKREFLLLKSVDEPNTNNNQNQNQSSNNNQGDSNNMSANEPNNTSANDKIDLSEYVEKSVFMSAVEELKAQNTVLIQKNESLANELQVQKEISQKRDIAKWIADNAPMYPGERDTLVTQIFNLEKVDSKLAADFRQQMIQTSNILANSTMFDSVGRNTDTQAKELDLTGKSFKEMKSELTKKGESFYTQYRSKFPTSNTPA